MKTGFKDLDEIIKVNKGDLIVVASRPAMGKSTFVLNILSHIALEENKSVLFFNLEDICIKSTRLKKKNNIDAIIIDYLQLIQFNKKKLLSRDEEITEILRKLKVLAKIEEKNMLKIVSGDIIENAQKYDAEAIVNPNNKYMDYGCGVCGAIYDAAGIEQIETYCHNKWIKGMEVNEIRITPGFYLQKEIIHIYAPIFSQEKNPIEKLKECYLKLFEKLIEEKYNSVIIPSLATGFHRL